MNDVRTPRVFNKFSLKYFISQTSYYDRLCKPYAVIVAVENCVEFSHEAVTYEEHTIFQVHLHQRTIALSFLSLLLR